MMPIISTGTIQKEILEQDWIVFLFEPDSKQYFRYSEGDTSVAHVKFVADDSKKGWHWESEQGPNYPPFDPSRYPRSVHVVDKQANILQLLRRVTKSLQYCEAVYGDDWPDKSGIQQNIRDAAEHLSQMLPDWQEAD